MKTTTLEKHKKVDLKSNYMKSIHKTRLYVHGLMNTNPNFNQQIFITVKGAEWKKKLLESGLK